MRHRRGIEWRVTASCSYFTHEVFSKLHWCSRLLVTEECDQQHPYVCSQIPLDRPPDNSCPRGQVAYRGKCLSHGGQVKLSYEGAQVRKSRSSSFQSATHKRKFPLNEVHTTIDIFEDIAMMRCRRPAPRLVASW